jgi:hypothetical protein
MPTGGEKQPFKVPLVQLTKKGLLVAETYESGYSLTSGFAAMKRGD